MFPSQFFSLKAFKNHFAAFYIASRIVFMGQQSSDERFGDMSLNWKKMEEIGDFPSKRFKHTLEVLPNRKKLLLLGGSWEHSNYFVFDLETNIWKEKSAPVMVSYHTSCLYSTSSRTFIVLYGGWSGPYFNRDLYEIEIEDDTENWNPVESKTKIMGEESGNIDVMDIPGYRYGHTSCISPDETEMIVFGGDKYQAFQNELWTYNVYTRVWEEITPSESLSPPPRAYHAAVTVKEDKKMYISGGDTTHKSEYSMYFDDLWCFCFVTNRWTQVEYEFQNQIIPRAGHQLMVLKNENHEEIGLIIGGGGFTDCFEITKKSREEMTSFWITNLKYSGKNRKWRMINHPNNNLIHSSYHMVQYQNKVYLYGGFFRILPNEIKNMKNFKELKREDYSAFARIKIPRTFYGDDDERERILFLKEYIQGGDDEGLENITTKIRFSNSDALLVTLKILFC